MIGDSSWVILHFSIKVVASYKMLQAIQRGSFTQLFFFKIAKSVSSGRVHRRRRNLLL